MLLDASALLALLYEEAGQDEVLATIMKGAAMSTANVSEVAAGMLESGWKMPETYDAIESFKLDIIPVDLNVAMLGAEYRITTKHLGLSLGDRLCLATAKLFNLPVLTADRNWLKVQMPDVSVIAIR